MSTEEWWSRVCRCFSLILADIAKPCGMINTQQQLQFNFGFRNCLVDSAMVECSLKYPVCMVIPLVGCSPLAMPFCGLCPVEDTHRLFIIMQIYPIDCWLLLGIISTVLSFFQWRVILIVGPNPRLEPDKCPWLPYLPCWLSLSYIYDCIGYTPIYPIEILRSICCRCWLCSNIANVPL